MLLFPADIYTIFDVQVALRNTNKDKVFFTFQLSIFAVRLFNLPLRM